MNLPTKNRKTVSFEEFKDCVLIVSGHWKNKDQRMISPIDSSFPELLETLTLISGLRALKLL